MFLRVVAGVVLLMCVTNAARHGRRIRGRGRGRAREETVTRETCELPHNQTMMNSFLWTIKRDPPSYFFGTIHVPYTKVWRFVADNAKHAFGRSQRVYFELDLTDPATVSRLNNCQLLPRGARLADVIPRRLYRRLQRHLDHVRVTFAARTGSRRAYAEYLFRAIAGDWRRKRAVWVMLMLNTLTEAEVTSRNVPVLDLYLAQEARRLGKQTGAIERVEEQCMPLNRLNLTQVVFALNQTLQRHERSRRAGGSLPHAATASLIQHYNCGDLDAAIFSNDTTTSSIRRAADPPLSSSDRQTIKEIDEYFHSELIYGRNRRIAGRVRRLLQEHPDQSFFFAFGAGHFLGNHSIVDEMRTAGFTVEHTLPLDPIAPSPSRAGLDGPPPILMADMPSHLSAVAVSANLEYLDAFYDRRRHGSHAERHHRRRRKGRRRERVDPTADSVKIHPPQFNDLWVRLDIARLDPNSYLRRHTSGREDGSSSLSSSSLSSSPFKYALYSSGSPGRLMTPPLMTSPLLALLSVTCFARIM